MYYSAVFEIKKEIPDAIVVVAVIGFVVGITRRYWPRCHGFLSAAPARQRDILKWLVFLSVAISATCAVLYFTSGHWVQSVIASAYAFMLVGYAPGCVFEVRTNRRNEVGKKEGSGSDAHTLSVVIADIHID